MESTAIFEQRISLTPKEMNRISTSTIDKILLEKLEGQLEGKCTKNGYVVDGSIKLLSRSMGQIDSGRFTGSFIYFVQAEGKVLYPTDGMILEVEVMRKNKMGIFAEYNRAIRVMLPRDLHLGNEEYENIEIGQRISVLVKKSRFQVNDPFILSVGVLNNIISAVEKKNVTAIDALKNEDEASDEE